MVDHIEAHGFAIVEGLIEPALVDGLLVELERLQHERPVGDLPPAPFSGFVTRRWFGLLHESDVWQEVAAHPRVLAVLRGILGDDLLLSAMGTAVIGPGEDAQPLHRDDAVYGLPMPHRHLVCNTMWALCDFTEDNGATRLVTGSHRNIDPPHVDASYDTVPAAMPRGSVCFILGTTYHGAGSNRTSVDRPGLTINYCDGSMRQQESITLDLALRGGRLLQLSPDVQDLLGYRRGRFGTGASPFELPRTHDGTGSVGVAYSTQSQSPR